MKPWDIARVRSKTCNMSFGMEKTRALSLWPARTWNVLDNQNSGELKPLEHDCGDSHLLGCEGPGWTKRSRLGCMDV